METIKRVLLLVFVCLFVSSCETKEEATARKLQGVWLMTRESIYSNGTKDTQDYKDGLMSCTDKAMVYEYVANHNTLDLYEFDEDGTVCWYMLRPDYNKLRENHVSLTADNVYYYSESLKAKWQSYSVTKDTIIFEAYDASSDKYAFTFAADEFSLNSTEEDETETLTYIRIDRENPIYKVLKDRWR